MMGVYVYEGETQNDAPVYVKRQGARTSDQAKSKRSNQQSAQVQIHYLYRSKTGSRKWHITVGLG